MYRRGEEILKFGKCWTKGRSRRLKNHVFDGSPSWIASYLNVICVSPIFCVILTKRCRTRRNLCEENLFGKMK